MVVVTEVAIVDGSMLCADRALRGLFPLVGRVLGAVGLQVLCRFVQEGMDGARYLALALEPLMAYLFRLIIVTVILPVTIAWALDTRALRRSAFVIIGAIVPMMTVDVPTLLLAIFVRVALGVA